MYLAYGSYRHQANACAVAIERDTIENKAENALGIHETWTITGTLTSSIGPSDIDAQIAALMDAYSDDGKDLVLYLPDGVTASSTSIYSATTLGGTRVSQQPSFAPTAGNERVNVAHFSIIVEAERPTNSGPILVDYQETITGKGGVPVIGWLEPAVGVPVQQTWKQTSTFKITQAGSATGYTSQPVIGVDVGLPLFLAAMNPQATEFEYEAPERIGDDYKNYKVTWHYEFEWPTPLIGGPNAWPINE
jgi:hypothetical protein